MKIAIALSFLHEDDPWFCLLPLRLVGSWLPGKAKAATGYSGRPGCANHSIAALLLSNQALIDVVLTQKAVSDALVSLAHPEPDEEDEFHLPGSNVPVLQMHQHVPAAGSVRTPEALGRTLDRFQPGSFLDLTQVESFLLICHPKQYRRAYKDLKALLRAYRHLSGDDEIPIQDFREVFQTSQDFPYQDGKRLRPLDWWIRERLASLVESFLRRVGLPKGVLKPPIPRP